MPKYEIIYIVEPEKSEENVIQMATDLKALIEKEGGTADHIEQWGKKKLAYSIGKHRYGYYTLFHVSGPGDIVAKLERNLRLNETVVKYITLLYHEKTLLRPSSDAPTSYGSREGGRY